MKQKTITENLQDLPKWAQSEVSTLLMRLRKANEELSRIKENPESNTILGHSYPVQNEKVQYLRNRQLITFMLEKGGIEAKIDGDFLTIRASGFAEGDLYVRPQVSNVIQIHLL